MVELQNASSIMLQKFPSPKPPKETTVIDFRLQNLLPLLLDWVQLKGKSYVTIKPMVKIQMFLNFYVALQVFDLFKDNQMGVSFGVSSSPILNKKRKQKEKKKTHTSNLGLPPTFTTFFPQNTVNPRLPSSETLNNYSRNIQTAAVRKRTVPIKIRVVSDKSHVFHRYHHQFKRRHIKLMAGRSSSNLRLYVRHELMLLLSGYISCACEYIL